jgi:phosphohistidine phosphatase SixA
MSSFGQGCHVRHWALTVVLLTLVTGCSSVVPLSTTRESPKPPTPTATTTKSNTIASAPTEGIWSKLQGKETGYVVMMRHALAPGIGDPPNFELDDCSTQRNLSAEGRAQAVRMGEAFRRRNIRVTKILSSQWCRCLETAKLMNLGSVEPLEGLNSFFRQPRTQSKQTAQVRRFIVDNRDNHGVIIMVTHQVNITALTDLVPQSGESVVLRANQQNQVELVGRIEGL